MMQAYPTNISATVIGKGLPVELYKCIWAFIRKEHPVAKLYKQARADAFWHVSFLNVHWTYDATFIRMLLALTIYAE